MAPTLGYWDIRGLGQPIRLLLAYVEADYIDKCYKVGPPPTFDKSDWLNEKNNLGLDFPNLPYYIDGNVKITQSNAILRHLGRKFNLVGKTEEENVRIDIVEQQLSDLNNIFTNLAYSQGETYENLKKQYLTTLPQQLDLLSKFLGDKPFLAGKNITYVDFPAYEWLDKQLYFSNETVKKFANLVQYHSRIEQLPTIKKYMNSSKFMKWPLNNDQATFGSRFQKP